MKKLNPPTKNKILCVKFEECKSSFIPEGDSVAQVIFTGGPGPLADSAQALILKNEPNFTLLNTIEVTF